MLNHSPDAWDAKGQLRLPLSFWFILLLQARTWLLFVMAGASRQQGSTLLALFYPDPDDLWLGLALGIPAALGLLLTGYRQRLPRLWQAWRWVLCASLCGLLAQQAWLGWQDAASVTPWMVAMALIDLLALGWLLTDRRLRDCFDPRLNHPE